jgi:Family of unknown function (DUF5317)
MLVLPVPVVLGLVAGVAAGGRLARWGQTRIDGWLIAGGGLGLQLAVFDPPLDHTAWALSYGPALYMLSLLLIAAVLAWNSSKQAPGLGRLALAVAATGILLNCLVILTNGGHMPRAALDGHTAAPDPAMTGHLTNVTPLTEETQLAWLGDVLPEPPELPLSNILSVGDVLLAAGLGSWAFAVTTGRGATRRSGTNAEDT